MKKYIIPAIKVKDMKMEALMAAMSFTDSEGGDNQLGKDNVFIEDEGLPKTPNVWDE